MVIFRVFLLTVSFLFEQFTCLLSTKDRIRLANCISFLSTLDSGGAVRTWNFK